MAKTSKSSDGLKKVGPGKWEARITARDPATGKKSIDTTRKIDASSKTDAMNARERIREELVGSGDEWTVDEAITEFLKTQRYGSKSTRKPHTNSFSEKFGTRKLSLVTTPEIQQWLAKLSCGDETASFYRATIMAVYKYALEQGRLRGANTAAATVKRRSAKTNDEWLEDLDAEETPTALVGDEIPRFFESLQKHAPEAFPIMKCQMLLGCRVSETIALKWPDVDWNTGVVSIRRNCQRNGEMGPTKGKKKRFAALGPEGLAFLRGHKAAMEREGWPGYDVWIFPRPLFNVRSPRTRNTWAYETLRPRVKDALEKAGLRLAAVTHAMRHTHVTLARALQVDAMLQAAVGHAGQRQTEGYTDNRARAAAAVGYAQDFEAQLAGGVDGGGKVTDIAKSLRKQA